MPFSFKEVDEDGLPVYAADAERAARVAGIAVRHARLRHIPAADKRLALVLSAYPTKHSRIGNAVGLDTPASAVALLRRLRADGYDLGPEDGPDALPGLVSGDGDDLIRALIEAGGHDQEWLTEEQLARNPVRVPAADYRRWYAALPQALRDAVEEHWGPPPGQLFVDTSRDPEGEIVLAALRRGNLLVVIQPPRGFGENPIAIYHDPDLPPSHHYLAAYRWMATPRADGGFGADAMVHLGKHGNLEWLPGKNAGLSAACGPDAALGDLPLIYPFLVNDPGEGTQAKRRVHATLVDHLVPPMARADSYGDIARLEQLLDEYAAISAMDPAKLPAIRAQIWTLIQAARLDHDLGLEDRPDDDGFDDFLLHVDGWLCEVKDAQIRDGLHVLGTAPAGPARVNLVLAILRARQIWGGTSALPGLREALGLDESAATRTGADEAEERARGLVQAMEDAEWAPEVVEKAVLTLPEEQRPAVSAILAFAAREVVPRLAATTDEIDHAVHALMRRIRPRGAVRLAAARTGQRPADRPQLLLRRPQGRAQQAGLGDRPGPRRFAPGALPRRQRRPVAEVRRPLSVGHECDAHLRRRCGRGAGAAGRPAGVGRRLAPGDGPGTRAARPAGPPARRCHPAHQRLLPGRLPPCRRAAGRRRTARRVPGGERRGQLHPGTHPRRPRRTR